jgi:hypothetical protein
LHVLEDERAVVVFAAAMFHRALQVITRDASAAHVHKPRPRANLTAPSGAGLYDFQAGMHPDAPGASPEPLRAQSELSSIDSLGIVLVEQCLARPAELRPVRPQTALDPGIAPNRAKAESHHIASACRALLCVRRTGSESCGREQGERNHRREPERTSTNLVHGSPLCNDPMQ